MSSPHGIIIFGANGSGKTTLGRELANVLRFKHMDIEDYHFEKSEIPYTVERSNEDCLNLMLSDIKKHRAFVISAVTGDFGDTIPQLYKLAVFVSAPIELRIKRIEQREYEKHGERICKGGDMYEQHKKFADFVASRSLSRIDHWAAELSCPVLQVDGTKEISKNTELIVKKYLAMQTNKHNLP
jgi:uridine kinase